DASSKNILKTSLNFKGNLIEIEEKNWAREEEELDQKTLLQKTADEINAKKDMSKELFTDFQKLLTNKLHKANAKELNPQITEVDNIGNLQLRNWKANNAKKNLKPIEDDRTDIQYNTGISCQNNLGLVKDNQLMKNIEDKTSTKEECQKFIKRENKIIINKVNNNIVLYCQEEIDHIKFYKDWNKKINHTKEIQAEKNEHEAFKSYKRPTELDEQTKIKDKLKAFSYYQNSAKIEIC
ncbi:7828_t:CDS:2, partial [Gigaspora rosea]